ncbi:hypothetical protein ACSBR1_003522 [Camellia fascicularis]
MAYRRRQGVARTSTFKEEIHYPPPPDGNSSSSSSSSSSLAAQAIRASAAHRDSSSLSSAYADSAFRQRPEISCLVGICEPRFEKKDENVRKKYK